MPWTHIASATVADLAGPQIDSTGANFLIAAIRFYGASSGFQSSGSATGLNTWTQIGTTLDIGGQKLAIYYCDAPAYTGTSTGVKGDQGYFTCSIAAFSRPSGALTVGTPATATAAASTSLASGSLTPAADDALIAAWLSFNGDVGAPASAPSGFTAGGLLSSINSSRYGGGQAYLNQTTAAAVNPSWTVPTSSDLAVAAVAFTVAGGDTTPPTLTSGTATGGTLTGTGGITSNEAGTLYWQVNGSAAPLTYPGSGAMSGWTSRSLTVGAQTWGLGSLAAGSYYLHLVADDAVPNRTAADLVLGPFTVSAGGTAPSITTHPSNQSVVAGSTATFTAAASGSPTPTVQWQRNGSDISGATSTSYTTPATTVTGGSANNGDTYRAVFTNASGSATTNSATLAVSAGGGSAGFDFHTAAGCVFGAISGSLTGLAREVGVNITPYVYNASTGALVATLATTATNSAGRLPRLTHASLAAGTTYRVTFVWPDGAAYTISMAAS